MIKVYFLLILLNWLLCGVDVDSAWVGPVSGVNTNYDYVSGTWLNDKTSIIVGNRDGSGILVKSTNFAKTWTNILTVATGRLFDISSSNNIVVSVSEAGYVYYSSDSGETWASVLVSLASSFYGVTIGSNGNVYIVGNTIYKSTLTDLTLWVPVYTVLNNNVLYGVSSLDGVNVITVGKGGIILASSDEGTTWVSKTSGTASDLYGIASIPTNSSVFMVSGSAATVLVTTNAGVSWRVNSLAGVGTGTSGVILSNSIFYFRSITMLTSSRAFLASPTGVILSSRNTGKSWLVTSSQLNYPLFSISAYNESVAVVGSGRISGVSAVFRRTPGNEFSPAPTSQPTSFPTGFIPDGTEWVTRFLGQNQYRIVDAAWSSPTNVAIVGSYLATSGVILYSTNAGFNWNAISTQTALTGVSAFVGSTVTYYLAVSQSGSVYLSMTPALGQNWTQQSLPSNLYGISISKDGVAYAVGYLSTGCFISKSLAPFTTWSSNLYTTTNAYQLNNIFSFNSRHIIAIGNAGVILSSSDSGATWSVQTSGTVVDLYSISGINVTDVVVGGMLGTLLLTKDTGVTWKALQSPSPTSNFRYNSLSMLSTAVIYTAGSSGFIQYSDNSGRSWQNDSNIPYQNGAVLYCISMYSPAVGVSADGNGNAYVKYQRITPKPTYQPTYSKSPILSTDTPTVTPTVRPTSQISVYMYIPVEQSMVNIPVSSTASFNPPPPDNRNRTIFHKAVSSFVFSFPSKTNATIQTTRAYYRNGQNNPNPSTKGVTFNYTLRVLLFTSSLTPNAITDAVYKIVVVELRKAVNTSTCNTTMRAAFNKTIGLSHMTCEPFINIGPYTLGFANLDSSSSSSSNLALALGLGLGLGMCFLLTVVFVWYKYCRGDSDESDESGSCFGWIFGGLYFISCCCCIYMYRSMCQRKDDDDDDDDDEDNRKSNKKNPTYDKSRTNRKQKEEEEEEEEDDDDDNGTKKKGGWLSGMFGKGKAKDDDDDEEEEEEEEEEKPKKRR